MLLVATRIRRSTFHLVPDIYGGILDRSSHSEGLIPEVGHVREK